jgi:hypothetical protein
MNELGWIYVTGYMSCAQALCAHPDPAMASLPEVAPALDDDAALMRDHGPAGAALAYRAGVRSAYEEITVHASFHGEVVESSHLATAIDRAARWLARHRLDVV